MRYSEKNILGDATPDYVAVSQPWASFRTLQANERLNDGGNLAEAEVEFRIKKTNDIVWLSAADRVLFAGKVYDILAVEPFGVQDEGYAIKCKLRDAING